jgi:hypothetical protein
LKFQDQFFKIGNLSNKIYHKEVNELKNLGFEDEEVNRNVLIKWNGNFEKSKQELEQRRKLKAIEDLD